MSLQSSRLSMVGLGVVGDVPPNPIQPPLVNAIHLRWTFDRDLGFPWYGFYLFRRLHRERKARCLSGTLTGMAGTTSASIPLATPEGSITSDTSLTLTEDFSPPGQPEIDLRDRRWVRLTLPDGQPAYRTDVTIGLREDTGGGQPERTCVDFSHDQPSTGPNPLIRDDVSFEAWDASGNPMPATRISEVNTAAGTLSGLDCGFRLQVRLPCVASEVELKLTHFARAARVEAIDAAQSTVAEATMTADQREPQTLVLTGAGIVAVVVVAPRNETVLHNVCFRCEDGDGGRPAGIVVTALSGQTPAASTVVTGAAGQVRTVSLRFDQLTAIEVQGGTAALIDVCIWFVAEGATVGWEAVPGFPYPMCLPVRHPDYPCSGNAPVDPAAAAATALGRVRYGDPADWQGQPFQELHDELIELVQGGPGATPMAQRARVIPGVEVPPDPGARLVRMPSQRSLDLVLVAALHPAVAQMLGLYWADTRTDPARRYDYLVVADHTGVGGRSAGQVLAVIAAAGFTQLDGYIVFDLQMVPAPPLGPPTGLRAYALPAGTIGTTGGGLQDWTNNAGLRWDLQITDLGILLPGAAVLYHLWRADLGNADLPAAPVGYDPLTKDAPILVGLARTPPGTAPQRPTDWPPLPLHTIDGGLADGWYSYKVSGVDIFGRHSPTSGPGPWYQWAPLPDPRPWYYQDPPVERAIHPSAIRLLDKTPPPPPTGVEAYALDPADPLLVADAAYTTWLATLSPAEQAALIGLRVRWRWTETHMRQAPDTVEFRIYFNQGSNPPGPDAHVATNWQERRYVVGYNQHVTVGVDAGGRPVRLYEVLLPAPGDAVRDSLPLTPTLADPIAYGNAGVSAADGQAHTADDPKWAAGHWGGHTGNEGRLGPPAKVYRVRRVAPDAPVPPADSERVFATPADYQSRSFYTFRWRAVANLWAHVFRAMDESVYQADWAQRPRVALGSGDLQYFPQEAIEPRWDAAKRQQVANELNQLNAFPKTDLGKAQALAYCRGLSNDGLRVLAGLPGVEAAFVQLTIQALDPADPLNGDRAGPDNPATYVPDPNLRAYVDTLDGRSTNRYFYRAAYVDGAQNPSALGLSGPPVWLPNVVRPRTPRVTEVTAGDRQIILTWASNREPDLAEYRVYRTDVEQDARDLRLMALVHSQMVAAGDPAARPASVSWTDNSVPGLQSFFYRLVAVDEAGNVSAPTPVFAARAFDDARPPPPTWNPPGPGPGLDDVALSWNSPIPNLRCLVQRRIHGAGLWEPASGWLARGAYAFTDTARTAGLSYDYRLRVMDDTARTNNTYNELTA